MRKFAIVAMIFAMGCEAPVNYRTGGDSNTSNCSEFVWTSHERLVYVSQSQGLTLAVNFATMSADIDNH